MIKIGDNNLNNRYITDSEGVPQEVKKTYVGDNLIYLHVQDNDAQFYKRATANSAINDGVKVNGTIKSIKGNIIVWNQLAPKTKMPIQSATTTYVDGYTDVVLTNATNYVRMQAGFRQSGFNAKDKIIVISHVSEYSIVNAPLSNLRLHVLWNLTKSKTALKEGSTIIKGNKAYAPMTVKDDVEVTDILGFYFDINNGSAFEHTTDDHFKASYNIFNLTKMFGAGNEPTTVEEFEALFPLDYYEYDEGSIISFKGQNFVTVGFNLLNISNRVEYNGSSSTPTDEKQFSENEYWNGFAYNGYYNNSIHSHSNLILHNNGLSGTGKNVSYGVGFPIKCKSNTAYYIDTTYGAIGFFDKNGKFLNKQFAAKKGIFTTPEQCVWMVVVLGRFIGDYVENNVILNLSCAKNGIYKPYEKHTLPISVTTLTSKGNMLPSEYVELEYLESTGGQYIDTGIVLNSKAKVIAVAKFNEISSDLALKTLWGYRDTSITGNICILGSQNNKWYTAFGSIYRVGDADINKHIFVNETDGLSYNIYIDDELLNHRDLSDQEATAYKDNTTPIFVFAAVDNGSAAYRCKARIYNFTIIQNDQYVINLIPAKRISDDVLGMYDTITGTFFTNDGTGSFNAGPEITPIFPNGMHGIGNVKDEIDFEHNKAIKRIGSVDLGELTWVYETQYDRYRFIAQNTASLMPSIISVLPNMLCQSIDVVAYSDFWNEIANDINNTKKAISYSNSGGILVHYPDTTDAATFKAAMSGVMLYYELAEPIEIDLDNTINGNYIADTDGTEEITPENGTVPYTAMPNLSILYRE